MEDITINAQFVITVNKGCAKDVYEDEMSEFLHDVLTGPINSDIITEVKDIKIF